MSKRSSGDTLNKGSSKNGSESLSDLNSSDKQSGNTDDEVNSVKKQKLAFAFPKNSFTKTGDKNLFSKKKIQIKLGPQKPSQPVSTVKSQSLAVAAAFNVDEEEEAEEMPPEARMKMRNIGRDTPTSAGPNSFGKTKQGFCDAKKMFEKTMKKAMDSAEPTSNKPQ